MRHFRQLNSQVSSLFRATRRWCPQYPPVMLVCCFINAYIYICIHISIHISTIYIYIILCFSCLVSTYIYQKPHSELGVMPSFATKISEVSHPIVQSPSIFLGGQIAIIFGAPPFNTPNRYAQHDFTVLDRRLGSLEELRVRASPVSTVSGRPVGQDRLDPSSKKMWIIYDNIYGIMINL